MGFASTATTPAEKAKQKNYKPKQNNVLVAGCLGYDVLGIGKLTGGQDQGFQLLVV